jgi:hypothetical protein
MAQQQQQQPAHAVNAQVAEEELETGGSCQPISLLEVGFLHFNVRRALILR